MSLDASSSWTCPKSRAQARRVFVFFSNKLGCLGSMLVSIVGTLILLSMLHVI
ncbi:MAG TPA: hypothetical protein VGF91_08085 [Solirubrobacteraceae bacterium]|jgi:hypothetical protein